MDRWHLILSGSKFDLHQRGHSLYWLSPLATAIVEVYQFRHRLEGTCRVSFRPMCREVQQEEGAIQCLSFAFNYSNTSLGIRQTSRRTVK